MKWIGSPVAEIWPFPYIGAYGTPIFGLRGSRRGSAMTPLKRAMVVSYRLSIVTVAISVKERRPVGLPATGNERHGVQGSTPVSEGCDRYHPLLLP